MNKDAGCRVPGLSVIVCLILMCVIVPAPPAQAGEQVFSPDPVWSSGHTNSTSGIALGDVDGDGDLDLVCGNYAQSNTLYLNEHGSFAINPVWSSASETPTRGMALGDVDGDGDLDVVFGDWEKGASLHLNEGGTFSASPVWESESLHTTSVALGDIDGDGHLDLVCGNDGEKNTLYLNAGAAFSSEPDWSSESYKFTESVTLGDIDGDGDIDLVCGNFAQSNDLYLNSDSTFSTGPVWSSLQTNHTTATALGDIDGDGDLDLVCGNSEDSDMLYLNLGGVFSPDSVWSSGPASDTHGVELSDVDGDGDLDLVCGNFAESNTLYLNSGGTFPSDPDWLSGPEDRTLCIVPGDVDGDGDPDLVCGNGGYPARSNTMYRNETPALDKGVAWQSAPRRVTHSVALGDVDQDGDRDLVCGNATYSSALYLNDGNLFATSPTWLSGVVSDTRGVGLGDIDGDGDLDLVCGNWGTPNIVYLNGGGVFSTDPSWTSDSADFTTSVALGDINGDGALDLVCGNSGDHGQSNRLYLNDGDSLSEDAAWSSGEANLTESVALGDVDGDGDLDLVCGNFAQGNTLYLNKGGIFEETPVWTAGPPNHTLSVALGDVDGDGDLDLVCGNSSQSNMLYENEGGIFSSGPAWSCGPANVTESVALADIDGDGDLDLICGNDGQSNTLYVNDGNALRTGPDWLSDLTNSTKSIALCDMDNDGDQDLICGNSGQSNNLYKGIMNPVFRGDPADPANHLPNNTAFLGSVSVNEKADNTYQISISAFDVESDPVWIVPEYQFRGVPTWYAAEMTGYSGSVGPLKTSPQGEEHIWYWDVSRLPFDTRGVILRLRTISTPLRVSSIRRISSHTTDVGHVEPVRPEIASSTALLSFPTLTVGDTASSHFTISNTGNELLILTDAGLPSVEMRCDLCFPHVIDSGDSINVSVFLMPRMELTISGELLIESTDPVTPFTAIEIETDIRALEIETRLLASAPEVPLGEALTAIVTPGPGVNVERGFLYHRPSGAGAFADSIPLAASAGDFIAVIPGGGVTESGLEYYIKVENSGIFATDPVGAPHSGFFYQAVASPAAISVTPRPNSGSDFLKNRDITVLVSLPDGTEFIEGTLYMRMGGESAYGALALEEPAPLPIGIIPDSLVGARGVEYWVRVLTLTTDLTYPAVDPAAFPAAITVTVPDLQEEEVSPAGEYRMVTIPLDFGEDFTGTLEALLSDQGAFGPYDPMRWRCFRYRPGPDEYEELSDETIAWFRPVPGRAFWLISSSASRISTAPVRGYSTATDSAFSIVLETGWNQIGNPFVFPVAWDSLAVSGQPMADVESVLVEPAVAWHAGEGYTYGVEILEPFRGYWVKNLESRPVTLTVPPRQAGPGMTAASAPGALSRGGSGWDETWRIEIVSSCGDVVDAGNSAGTALGAATGWDKHDRSEPPMCPGRSMSLYFPHQSWMDHPGRYTTDIRGVYEALGTGQLEVQLSEEDLWGHAWIFDVAKTFSDAGVADNVLLGFDGLETLPEEARVYLIDRKLERIVDLRNEAGYSFHSGERLIVPEEEARFMLLVGSREFINRHDDELPGPPARTALHQNYPNPFGVSTIIRYDLARRDNISLRVYDAAGALVRVLYEGSRGPGRYESVWMGENDSGRRAATGIYFCSFTTATGTTASHKLLLIR
ncbi:MAG: FG-GAP-like repeat-containing protein [Candidatus Eisenbacteria bacterium]